MISIPPKLAANPVAFSFRSLVIYVGMEAIASLQQAQPPSSPMRGAEVEIFLKLLDSYAPKNRYAFLSALANQLRYPNSHTHFFSQVMLYVFENAPANDAGLKEQVRVGVRVGVRSERRGWGWGFEVRKTTHRSNNVVCRSRASCLRGSLSTAHTLGAC